jgi:hypothetical protein
MKVWIATKMRNWKPQALETVVFTTSTAAKNQLKKWAQEILDDAILIGDLEEPAEIAEFQQYVDKLNTKQLERWWDVSFFVEPKTIRGPKK